MTFHRQSYISTEQDDRESPANWRLDPEDRLGPPPRKSSTLLTTAVVALLTIAGGMFYFDDRVRAPETAATPPPTETASIDRPAALPMQTLPPQSEAPGIAVVAPAPASEAERRDPDADKADDRPERLPPPVVDKSNPLQVRAAAVGLNPGLSSTLLAKLTDEDFRNAAIAIKTAIADTPDNQDYTYPRQGKAGLAIFNVRFVLGAPAECRRYIVTVTQDRWSHTALPMESCGAERRPAASR